MKKNKKSKKKHLVNVVMLIECAIEVKDLEDCEPEINVLTSQLNSMGINVGSIENIEEIEE